MSFLVSSEHAQLVDTFLCLLRKLDSLPQTSHTRGSPHPTFYDFSFLLFQYQAPPHTPELAMCSMFLHVTSHHDVGLDTRGLYLLLHVADTEESVPVTQECQTPCWILNGVAGGPGWWVHSHWRSRPVK